MKGPGLGRAKSALEVLASLWLCPESAIGQRGDPYKFSKNRAKIPVND